MAKENKSKNDIKSTIKYIYCKEMRRVFFDPKMVFGLFIMPVVLMVVIYGLVAVMSLSMEQDISEHISEVYVYNCPDSFKDELKADEVTDNLNYVDSEDQLSNAKQQIIDGEADLIIEFPADFEKEVNEYKDGDEVAEVNTYYNPSEDYSSSAYSKYTDYIENYRISLLEDRIGNLDSIQVFTVDENNDEHELQDEDKAGGQILGEMLPYLVCMLLFAGVMGVGVDTIAGEKERGTMATLLVLPVKRTAIVYGKMLALMSVSGLSALVYGGSMLVAVPFLAIYMAASGMSFHISLIQGFLLILLIISLVFLYVAIIAVCSVFSKDLKEANTYVMPAYILVIVLSMMTMFKSGDTAFSAYLVPLYGPAMAMRNILTQEISNVEVMMAIGMDVLIGAILAFVITKAFDNERVMFNA